MLQKRRRVIDRPSGTNCHVPGYAEDGALAGSGMRTEYYDTQQDQFAGRPRRDGRAPGTDCWVPGYLNDEDQARVDGLGLSPLVIAGAAKLPSLFNPKATKGNHVQRFLVSQAGGKVRGSKTQGIPNAKILIDQAYYHGWQHAGIPDAQDWRNMWDEMFQQAIPELKAYMLSKMPAPALPTKPGTQPPTSVLPPYTPVGPTAPIWTPPPLPKPGPGEVISTQPLPQLPGGSYQPPVPGYDPGQLPPTEPPPAPAGGGFKDLLSNPTTLILAGVAAFALLGGGRRGNPRRRRR
jgi:hypothetical protein